ncbi:hypothetical protein Pst134EB_022157 [Puccinia striiformis f. sp. tritici]|nr:hypothetical protein Pst134EB_022157 [Puccinia striiformis f. sp. tritici]
MITVGKSTMVDDIVTRTTRRLKNLSSQIPEQTEGIPLSTTGNLIPPAIVEGVGSKNRTQAEK